MLLPDDAQRDKINARVENGVLKVNIPKVAKAKVEETKKVIAIQ
jgi:HSP20 family molecular chaperone IbpA